MHPSISLFGQYCRTPTIFNSSSLASNSCSSWLLGVGGLGIGLGNKPLGVRELGLGLGGNSRGGGALSLKPGLLRAQRELLELVGALGLGDELPLHTASIYRIAL